MDGAATESGAGVGSGTGSGVTVVACAQVRLAVGDPAANRAATLDAIDRAAEAGARIVVLPELANSGYVFRDAAEAAALAEPVGPLVGDGSATSATEAAGPTVGSWTEAARRHGIVLVAGLAEKAPDGLIRNSAVLIDPDGVRAVYRKAHLWGRESEFFVPGDAPPPVVATAFGDVGLMVCYDLEFPEWVRLPALSGAELLCAPVNWPYAPRPEGERPAEVVRVQADAAVNRMFVAACDRAGPERGTDWVGGSVITDPDGFPLAGPHPGEETLLLAECRLADARDKHIGTYNDVHADRRPELYAPVAAGTRNTVGDNPATKKDSR